MIIYLTDIYMHASKIKENYPVEIETGSGKNVMKGL